MDITDQSKQVSNFCSGVSNETVPIAKKEVTPVIFHVDSALLVSPRSHIFIVWLFHLCNNFSLSSAAVAARASHGTQVCWFLVPWHVPEHWVTSFFVLRFHRELLLSGSQLQGRVGEEGIKKQHLNSYKIFLSLFKPRKAGTSPYLHCFLLFHSLPKEPPNSNAAG